MVVVSVGVCEWAIDVNGGGDVMLVTGRLGMPVSSAGAISNLLKRPPCRCNLSFFFFQHHKTWTIYTPHRRCRPLRLIAGILLVTFHLLRSPYHGLV